METLLGLSDGYLDRDKHVSSFLINKVGGVPDWLPGVGRPSPCCDRCRAQMAHVVQVYCPLEASPYHRNLHLFACPSADCSGRSDGWVALRSQGLEAAAGTSGRPPPEPPLPATDWCETADDWGQEEEALSWGGGPGPKEASAAETDGCPAACETDVGSRLMALQLDNAPAFRPFFISVVEESDLCAGDEELVHAQELLRAYERREGVVVAEVGGGGGETYEKARARHGDAVFSRFMKTISRCPQQVLRYSRGSQPLFVSPPPANMAELVAACGSCGRPRTFELQLMPAMVSLLRREDGGSAEVEFGTVLVYTCSSSCWTHADKSPRVEVCLVQNDPDHTLFR